MGQEIEKPAMQTLADPAATPDGATSSGATSNGATPDSTTPDGTTPDGAKSFRICGMFFSGTGTTEKIVTVIAQTLADALVQQAADLAEAADTADTAYTAGVATTADVADAVAAADTANIAAAADTADAAGVATTDAAGSDSGATIRIEKQPDINFTPPAAREQTYRFGNRDIVVFGVPVIAGRVPNVLLPFLNTLEGGGALAIPVVLYGNRNFDDALIELRNILEERGFHTIAAAAFIGEHSFSRVLAAGRPDAEDLETADRFARDVAEKIRSMHRDVLKRVAAPTPVRPRAESTDEAAPIPVRPGAEGTGEAAVYRAFRKEAENMGPVKVDGQDPLRPYYRPRDRQGNFINILKVKPKLDEAKCTGCGICAEVCPMGSITKEEPGIVKGICIKCCGCEKKCPEGALYFDDPGYLYHKEELELGYPDRKEPALFL